MHNGDYIMQHKNLPPLNALKAFEVAARTLSFTKAADELCVTQAAISHQIKLLEDYLGFALFIRKSRALELSHVGSDYFREIRPILQRLAEVTSKLKTREATQYLTIKVPQTFGMAWLVPHLSEFNQLYPQIEVNIQGVDYDESNYIANADVAIFYGKGDWKEVYNQKLLAGKLLILASPQLLARKRLVTFADLAEHNLLHIHNRDNWKHMLSHLNMEKIDIRHGAVFSHTFMALQAALHGQGVVLANSILAQEYVKEGSLVDVFETDISDPKAFYVVCHTEHKNKPEVVAFINWITHYFQQLQDKDK